MESYFKSTNKIKNLFLFLFFLIIIINFGLVSAQDIQSNNLTNEQKAILCFNESKQYFNELHKENFSILRVNDSLKQLENLFNAQIVLKDKKRSYDFSLVLPYCEDISNIRNLAFESRDKINALKKFYSESTLGLNTSSVDEIMNEIEQEMKNEKYEKVSSLVDEAYKEIVTIKSSQTTLNVFYSTTSKTIGQFFYNNRFYIIGSLVFLFVLFLIYRTAIRVFILNQKIKKLELRKKTLKGLIMSTQKDYFTRGNISDGTFNIRTKKLAELVRDIDRQIPLLQEELAKIQWKGKNSDKESI